MNERQKGDDDSFCSKKARRKEEGSIDRYQTATHKTKRRISHPLEHHKSFFIKKKRLIVRAPKTVQTSCSRVLLFPANKSKERWNFPGKRQKTRGHSRYGPKKFRQAQSLEHCKKEGRNERSVPLPSTSDRQNSKLECLGLQKPPIAHNHKSSTLNPYRTQRNRTSPRKKELHNSKCRKTYVMATCIDVGPHPNGLI